MRMRSLSKLSFALGAMLREEPRHWWVYAEVALVLAAAKFCVAVSPTRLPFKLLEGLKISRRRFVADPDLLVISQAIERSSRLLPGRFVCLPQALAASFLFWRRDWSLEVRVGVRKGECQPIEAHAWSLSGQSMITGACEESEYQLLRSWNSGELD